MLGWLATAGCGGAERSPVGPDGVMDFTGAWQGQYRVTACTGERNCVHTIGAVQDFALRLVQQGRSVEGVFSSVGTTIDVVGQVEETDVLTLRAVKNPSAGDYETESFTSLDATLHGSALTGRIEYTSGYRLSVSYPVMATTRTVDVISAQKGVLSPAFSFDGSWRGDYVVISCSTNSGWQCESKDSGESVTTELVFDQAGSTVTGSIRLNSYTVPLTGAITDGKLSLAGELDTVISGGHTVYRVVNWTATRDAVGRMQGTFDWIEDIYFDDRQHFTMTLKARLSEMLPTQ